MRTIIFLLSGLICFVGITGLRAIDQLPLGWYVFLCIAGMVTVAVVLRLRVHPLHTSWKLLEET
jgi:hypothetical protein